jgi:hypothetical protein
VVEPIQDKLSNYRENWKTHLERMPEERYPNRQHSTNLEVAHGRDGPKCENGRGCDLIREG